MLPCGESSWSKGRLERKAESREPQLLVTGTSLPFTLHTVSIQDYDYLLLFGFLE